MIAKTLASALALAAVLTPVGVTVRDARAEQRTRASLVLAAAACGRFFAAAGRLPGAMADLEPCLEGVSDRDGWQRPFALYRTPRLVALRSAGANGRHGDPDDLCRLVGLERLQRAETHARLVRVNAAIVRYNGSHQLDAPLPPDYAQVLARLVQTGYLAADAALERDAWGEPFEEDPRGQLPVVRVRSRSMGPWRGR